MPDISAFVVLDHVRFAWPDGTIALDDVSGAFSSGRTGLIGRNGSGKTTLLRLLSGELRPTSGRIETRGEIAVLPQHLTRRTEDRVADLLGIAAPLDAVRAIAAGDVAPWHFDAVGDDWDIEERAAAALAEASLAPELLDRSVGALSGGEAVLVALTGIRLRRPALTLLDEPTNNLDRAARARLGGLVRSWHGTLIVVSHDTELLDLMDDTAELYENTLTVFGGPYAEWRSWRDAEQRAARQAEKDAAQRLRTEKRQRIDAETTLARRARTAKKAQEEKRVPKIVAHGRRAQAEVSAGKLRAGAGAKEDAARRALDEAGRRVRDDDRMAILLPDPEVSPARRIATISDAERAWIVQGPERIALVGANGAGKTTLLERLVTGTGPADAPLHAEAHTARIGYLPQRLDGLDETASVLANVQRAAPHVPEKELRNSLARFLLRGATTERPVSALSGGERFRVALARILLASPPPQLVVLDEPTNNLDIDTAEQLVAALRAYRGAIVVVSHDVGFLRALAPNRVLEIDDEGRLREQPADAPQ